MPLRPIFQSCSAEPSEIIHKDVRNNAYYYCNHIRHISELVITYKVIYEKVINYM